MKKLLRRGLGLVAVSLCLGGTSPAAAPEYAARIQWTAYGIPHVEAGDFGGLGFGVGYALAKGNACLLFDTALTVRGERSQFFGPDGEAMAGFRPARNIDSDAFFKGYFDPAGLESAYRAGPPDVLALLQGYVAGINRYLADTGADKLPEPCRNAAWVRPVTLDDAILMVAQKAVEASGGAFPKAIVNARPPGDGEAPKSGAPNAESPGPKPNEGGSNAYALGRDLTANGRGLLVGNPHFPWQRPNRFFELHMTVPGKLDVMGASILFLPIVNIGFNRDVAWSHTVSTGRRFTLFQLQLVPGHPLEYLVDGRAETMRPKTVTVLSLGADHAVTPVTRTLYETRFGRVVVEPALGLNWTAQTAFAFADSEVANTRVLEQWLRLGQAKTVAEVRATLAAIQGPPWVNTLAADRAGDVFYGDFSVVPAVDDALLQHCKGSPLAQEMTRRSGFPVLDGTRGDCDWLRHPNAGKPGVMAADRMPSLMRTDYVLNSNDSYWLVNAAQPLTGYPAAIGSTGTALRLRTRMGYKALDELIAGKRGRITPGDMEEMVLGDRNYAGELVHDDLATLCKGAVPAAPEPAGQFATACRTLALWDRKDELDSRGAAFFREFWRKAGQMPSLWRVGFDPANPLQTPNGLRLDDAGVQDALRQALVQTVKEFQALGLETDVALGKVQQRGAPPGAIPIPGGEEFEGVLNEITLGPLSRDGYDHATILGSSYIQVVTWDKAGPRADALLTYSQSADPASPHYADQTKRYADQAWIRLPFTAAEIAADRELKTQKIRQ
jgi:acyl-homoserine-lactone acylase